MAICGLLLTLFIGASSWNLVHGDGEQYRLPRKIIPVHYNVHLSFDISPTKNFSYYGQSLIQMVILEDTDKITLHGRDFKLNEAGIKFIKPDVELKKISKNLSKDFLIFELNRTLKKNENVTMLIPYFGQLNGGLKGIYISSYTNKKINSKEYLVSTQFEPTYARRGFPCFDEPDIKATFEMAIQHTRDYKAISNMPLQDKCNVNDWSWSSSRKDKDLMWSCFENTVPMSTYLLAFVVSKFEHVVSDSKLSNVTFKIWARKDAIDQTSYASVIGPKVLSFFENYFDVDYPLPKQDLIAIPDFSAGAMENWGLITFRETALLYDEKESSLDAKQNLAYVISHELAHQWFGNLVTMKWWSDLWLNEGFATYVGYVGVNAVETSWNFMNTMAVEDFRLVLTLDALKSSHPVSSVVEDPDTISEIFDTISYRKGSTLIRMMQMFLTEKVFREGLKDYLLMHSYDNAEQDDLWNSLTQVAIKENVLEKKLSVKTIMDTWTKQTGFPILTIQRNYPEKSVSIQQKRYTSLNLKENKTSWWIPLSILTASDTQQQGCMKWIPDTEGVNEPFVTKVDADDNSWILVNYDMRALMRVNYDTRNWEMLIETLNSERYESIPEKARVQLLSDAFELAWTNHLDYEIPLNLSNFLVREKSFLPMETGLNSLGHIERVLVRTVHYGAIQKYLRKIITPLYKSSGGLYTKEIQNPDDLLSVKTQVLASRWACLAKVPNCEQNAIDIFKEWMETSDPDNENPIPVDLRSIVYCVALRRGSVEHWAFLFQRYLNSNVAQAKSTMMNALACTNEIWLLKQYLEWTIDGGSEIRTQDAWSVMSNVARSPVGFYVFKEFLYNRINDISKTYSNDAQRLGGVIKVFVSLFTKEDDLNEFVRFRKANEKYLNAGKLAIDQGMETAKVNIDWMDKNSKSVVERLRYNSA